jgi:ABC-type branched-subunit amino acid transport system substrate-binding protein
MVPRFRRGLLPAAILLAGLLLLSCGGNEKTAETPVAAQPTGGGTPGAQKVPGVTDTEILLGTHMPLSQTPAAAYAPVADAMRAYFEYVNSKGGVYGRKIRLLVGDDHYNPADTVEVVRKLVEQDKVFAIVGGLGDTTHSAVWKYLEENGVPDMFISGGLDKWTDPVVKTRFQGNPNYGTEEKMLAKYLVENFAGKKLGLLIENDEFGENGKKAILEGIEGSGIEVVAEETYESTSWDVTAQTERLKAANPDVVFAMAVAPPAAGLVKTAREVLNWDVPIVVTGVVISDLFIQLAGAENAEGVVSVLFGRQVYYTDDPAIQFHYEVMENFGQGVPVSNFTLYGEFIAEMMVKALENAGPNLTRESLVEGTEAIRDYCCPTCRMPVNFSPNDHRPCEMEVDIRVENGRWVEFGEPINFESTPGKVIGCKDVGEPIYAGEGQ